MAIIDNAFNESYNESFDIGTVVDPIINTTLSYKSNQTIFEKIVKCTVKVHELKYTLNPTTLLDPFDPFSDINPIFINSDFTPYVTTIGLYNDSNELLAVAKLEYPVKLPNTSDITFVIRIDF